MKKLIGTLALAAGLTQIACGSGETIVIGSKNFSEQVLLGEILAQQIERRSDLRVDRRLNLGGTFICDRALRTGEIDGYIEYTGTALKTILKESAASDARMVYQRVREAYAEDGLEWLEPLGFNNTFVILIRREDAQRLGIRTLSEASRHTGGWIAGFGYEFMEREDGFQGLAQTYDLKFAAAPRVMELGLTYRALAEKKVDLIAGDSTNGLIEALDLFALEDDRRYFPPYDAAPVFRRETLEQYPALRAVVNELAGTINESEMRRMNYEVDGKQRSPREVAAEFLRSVNETAASREE